MSSNEIVTTVVGWAATAPREIQDGRVPYTSFRLASTPRHFDRARQAWVEGRTEWFTVKVFRDPALNVAGSVLKGQPVVVHGRLRTEEWLGEHGPRTGLVIEASALGHDLTRGRSTFVRVSRVGGSAGTDGAGDGEASRTGAGTDPADPWAVDGAPGATGHDGPDGEGEDEHADDVGDGPVREHEVEPDGEVLAPTP